MDEDQLFEMEYHDEMEMLAELENGSRGCLYYSDNYRFRCLQDNSPTNQLAVTVQISSAIRDLMLIQHNKFYWISNRSGVADLIWTVTQLAVCHVADWITRGLVNSPTANF